MKTLLFILIFIQISFIVTVPRTKNLKVNKAKELKEKIVEKLRKEKKNLLNGETSKKFEEAKKSLNTKKKRRNLGLAFVDVAYNKIKEVIDSTVMPIINTIKQNVESRISETKEKIGPELDNAKEKIESAVNEKKEILESELNKAKEIIEPRLNKAKEKIESGADKAKEKIESGAEKMDQIAGNIFDRIKNFFS